MSCRRPNTQTAAKVNRKTSRKANRKATPKAKAGPNASSKASKTASKATSKAARKAACYFLQLPIEIRLNIYAYLLLDPLRASLDPDHAGYMTYHNVEEEDMDSDSITDSTDGYGDLDSEDGMFNFGGFNPYGVPMGDMCDSMFNEVYNNRGAIGFMNDMLSPPSPMSINKDGHRVRFLQKKVQKSKIKRHLAILRANHQIYQEASSLLRSDLTIDVTPGDAFTDIPANAVVKQTKKVWRHAPSDGLGFTDSNGQTVYQSLPLDGPMEPHFFARFEKVSYHADFKFERTGTAPSLYINDDSTVRADDAARFMSYLTTAKGTTRWFEDPIPGRPFDNGRRGTLEDVAGINLSSVTSTQLSTAEIIQKFVDLLSSSPLIRHLEFVLDLEVNRVEPFKDPGLDSDDETDSGQEAYYDERKAVGNERATELLLESGALGSLRKLSNVKCFSLKIAPDGCGDKILKPQQKHLHIIRDLKDVIEKNWQVKHSLR